MFSRTVWGRGRLARGKTGRRAATHRSYLLFNSQYPMFSRTVWGRGRLARGRTRRAATHRSYLLFSSQYPMFRRTCLGSALDGYRSPSIAIDSHRNHRPWRGALHLPSGQRKKFLQRVHILLYNGNWRNSARTCARTNSAAKRKELNYDQQNFNLPSRSSIVHCALCIMHFYCFRSHDYSVSHCWYWRG